MEQVLKAIQQLEKQMNNRFDQVDEKFVKVDQRFDQVEQKLVQVDQKLAENDKHFGVIDKKLEEGKQNFEGINQQLNRMETTLNAIAQTSNDDTVSILKRIDQNTKNMNRDIEYLSKQAGKHELYFNRMNKN
ncbi:hypothetical protein [Cytobacillus sp. NCCP-133]|uniref:hypothetical protein n=1 Tax=Cytobacillus sp. NCCP-133 TaxID=766848 RepID=UPI0022327866|nr:hypothetical protein [Cytobacillus sp. NCCP-133]GLB61823.1 hypothetical protein NCCP133_39520 [Cytobacillus sp. NCCP-133]